MKQNKMRSMLLAGAAVSALVATAGCSGGIVEDGGGAGGSETGKSVTLEFASFMPESHPYSQWYLAWAEEVTEATEGRVTFENYFSGSLYNGPDLTSAVVDGQVDLSQPNTNYTPERFPLSELVSVPYATSSVGGAISGLVDLYESYAPFTEEFDKNGVVPLQFQPTGTNVLGSNKELNTVSSIDGARVRSASYFATAMKELGGNPISMPLSDVYQSMQTGLIDAWMTPMENTIQFNLGEVTTHIQDPGMGPTSLSVILMNKKSLESLEPADQEAVLSLSAEYNRKFIDLLNQIDAETCTAINETDIVLERWSDAEIEAGRSAVAQSMLDAYKKDAAGAGADAAEFVEKWQSYQANYDGSYGEYAGSVTTCLGK